MGNYVSFSAETADNGTNGMLPLVEVEGPRLWHHREHNLQVSNMGKIKAAAAGIGAYEVGKHAHHHHEKHEA